VFKTAYQIFKALPSCLYFKILSLGILNLLIPGPRIAYVVLLILILACLVSLHNNRNACLSHMMETCLPADFYTFLFLLTDCGTVKATLLLYCRNEIKKGQAIG
jgi:hypothetical protein